MTALSKQTNLHPYVNEDLVNLIYEIQHNFPQIDLITSNTANSKVTLIKLRGKENLDEELLRDLRLFLNKELKKR